MKLEVLRNIIQFYLWVFTNCKLVKTVSTFPIYLFLVALESGVHVADVFFILVTVRSSELQEFGLVWLGFSLLLLLYLVNGQLALRTFFDGKKLHITTVVSNISLTNILLELQNTKIFKLIRIILRLILFSIDFLN